MKKVGFSLPAGQQNFVNLILGFLDHSVVKYNLISVSQEKLTKSFCPNLCPVNAQGHFPNKLKRFICYF